MTSDSPADAPSLYLDGRTGAVWLEDGAIVVREDGLRHRIPFEAVASVALDGRRLRVALHPAGGGLTYTLESRDTRTAALLVRTVTRALPVAGAPRDAAGLVTTEPDPGGARRDGSAGRKPDRALLGVLGGIGLYAAGTATVMLLSRDDGPWILWLFGTVPLFLGVAFVGSLAVDLRDWVIRRRRGVAVLATYRRDAGSNRVFAFTDAEGRVHEVRANRHVRLVRRDPMTIRFMYDPLGRLSSKVLESGRESAVQRTFYTLLGTPALAFGLYAVPFQLFRVLFLGG
ncbi:hypothetical protein ACIQXD_08900 [Streptomyces uncialis]|uniref:hypothetical protein n=1 Tax=Streptomyces uncialis TaxID=1048205 RepID=UPI00382E31A4